MFNQPIRSIAVVAAITLVSALFVDMSSAQLFGGRGGLFQRNRATADCCNQVSRCCPAPIAYNANQCCQSSSYGNTGYGNTGYGNSGYGNSGYDNSQRYPAYSNQSGLLLNGNAYDQDNANWQRSTQTSGQFDVNNNSNESGQQGAVELDQLRNSQNPDGTYQTNPQFNSPGTSTTEATGDIDQTNPQFNSPGTPTTEATGDIEVKIK